ncbi:MAG: hypothetical protein AB1472_03830, partial [Candidatus Omnitrophota bacterium]
MGEIEKLEFKLGEPIVVTMSFDQPKTGEGEYGTWWLYGCKNEGKNYNFFATTKLHEKLEILQIKKGTIVKIEKIAIEGENGKLHTDWKIEKIGKEEKTIPIPPANNRNSTIPLEEKARQEEIRKKQQEAYEQKQKEMKEAQEKAKQDEKEKWEKKDRWIARQCALKAAAEITAQAFATSDL